MSKQALTLRPVKVRQRPAPPKKAARRTISPGVRLALAAGLALIAFMVLYPVRYHTIASFPLDFSPRFGMRWPVDSVWSTFLNFAHSRGLIFGKDIEFTYGPLAYLALPMPIGTNLEQGIAFQIAAWCALGALLAWLVYAKRTPLANLASFAICAAAAARLFRELDPDGPDYFLEFMVVLFAGAALLGSDAFFAGAVLLTAILLLVKFSTGIAALSVVLVFPLVILSRNRSRALRLMSIAVLGVPVAVTAMFLLAGGTPSGLGQYFRSGLELSFGYSAAMSTEGPMALFYGALIILAGFVLLAGALFLWKDRSFPVAAAVLAPLFFELKHAFIRQDIWHTERFFMLAPAMLSAIVLFADLRYRARWNRAAILAVVGLTLISTPWLYIEQGQYYAGQSPTSQSGPAAALADLSGLADLGDFSRELHETSDKALSVERLPADLLQRLGQHSVAVYPFAISYPVANPIHFIPLPVLQAYSAYTPYLDGLNAGLLNDLQRRPEFVLFEWQKIDGRHPLLDCPQTALALYRNYQFDGMYGHIMLLRARATPLPDTMRLVKKTTASLGDPIQLETTRAGLVRIFLDYNLPGRLTDFLFRVPPVNATLSRPGGKAITVRIPPAVTAGGIPLSIIPGSFEDARRLFETGIDDSGFTMISISGPGSLMFKPTVRTEVYELPGLR